MMKECFKQEIVDAPKFRECAECPLFNECTGVVYQQNARGVSYAAEALGYLLGLVGVGVAVTLRPVMPNGFLWLLFVCVVYLIAVNRAAREYRNSNQEQRDYLIRLAEAKPEGGQPAPHAPAPAHH